MNNDTLATELLKEQKENAKRWFILFIVILSLWFATIGSFVVYLCLPDEVTQTTVEQQADGDGTNNSNIFGGDYNSNPTEDNANISQAQQTP